MSYQVGTVFGTTPYGDSTYGAPLNPNNPLYDVSNFTGVATSYQTIQLTWGIPTEGATLRLVRNNFSASTDQNAGIVLMSQGIAAGTIWVDTTLSTYQQGSFMYYTLWNQSSTGYWWRAGDVQVMLPKDWGTYEWLWSLIPEKYRDDDTAVGTVFAVMPTDQVGGNSTSVSSAQAGQAWNGSSWT